MNHPIATFNLSNIDLIKIIGYPAIVVLLGLYFGGKHEESTNYFTKYQCSFQQSDEFT